MAPPWIGGSECFARGGLFQPALELANRDELLPAAPHEAQLVRDVLGEELVADAEYRGGLGEGECEAGETALRRLASRGRRLPMSRLELELPGHNARHHATVADRSH